MDNILISEGFNIQDVDLESMISETKSDFVATLEKNDVNIGPEVNITIGKKTLKAFLTKITSNINDSSFTLCCCFNGHNNMLKAIDLATTTFEKSKSKVLIADKQISDKEIFLQTLKIKTIGKNIYSMKAYFLFAGHT